MDTVMTSHEFSEWLRESIRTFPQIADVFVDADSEAERQRWFSTLSDVSIAAARSVVNRILSRDIEQPINWRLLPVLITKPATARHVEPITRTRNQEEARKRNAYNRDTSTQRKRERDLEAKHGAAIDALDDDAFERLLDKSLPNDHTKQALIAYYRNTTLNTYRRRSSFIRCYVLQHYAKAVGG